MKLYFDRTPYDIFENESSMVQFYDAFFQQYNIDLTKSNYIHLYDNEKRGHYISKTIFFQDNRIIVYDAELYEDYIPYSGYNVAVYYKNNIKLIKINCDVQYNSTYNIKIDLEKEQIEFNATEQYHKNDDCKKAVEFLSRYNI